MYISDYLRESLQRGDIKEIRGALLGYIDMDPAFKTSKFKEAVDYVTERGYQVFEENDPEIFDDENQSDEDRFYQIKNGLSYNFSEERVQKLMNVGSRCMQNAPVYTVTSTSLYQQPSVPKAHTDYSSRKGADSSKHSAEEPKRPTKGQNQGMPGLLQFAIAVALVVLALVILVALIKLIRAK